jgi:hypothetical protein
MVSKSCENMFGKKKSKRKMQQASYEQDILGLNFRV